MGLEEEISDGEEIELHYAVAVIFVFELRIGLISKIPINYHILSILPPHIKSVSY